MADLLLSPTTRDDGAGTTYTTVPPTDFPIEIYPYDLDGAHCPECWRPLAVGARCPWCHNRALAVSEREIRRVLRPVPRLPALCIKRVPWAGTPTYIHARTADLAVAVAHLRTCRAVLMGAGLAVAAHRNTEGTPYLRVRRVFGAEGRAA